MKAAQALAGAAVGIVFGAVFGLLAVGWAIHKASAPPYPGHGVGPYLDFVLHNPVFWVVMLGNAASFALAFSVIGRGKRPSRL